MNVDLPSLTSINSVKDSFELPRSVTLESITDYWILMVFRYSKSSICQAIFVIPVCSIEISFEYCLIDLISFIDVSYILADLVEISSDSDWKLFIDSSLIRNIWMEWLFVCFKPILDHNAWFQYYQNIIPVCLIMLFSLPILQWYWIRIDVSINQPFISKMIIMLFITNDPSIIYWTFINDDGCNLPIITK